jgi:hypothetical protein
MKLSCITTTYEWHCKKCQMDKSRCSWKGKSHKIVEGDVVITSTQSRGQLVPQADELSSRDNVEVLEVPRGDLAALVSSAADIMLICHRHPSHM